MFRFTIRDVLWLTVVVALGVGWWLNSHSSDRETYYKAWAFDIAADILKEKTGHEMAVNAHGVWVKDPSGATEGHSFSHYSLP